MSTLKLAQLLARPRLRPFYIASSRCYASLQNKTYQPPALGVNPAYDEALNVIAADRDERIEKLGHILKEIEVLNKDSLSQDDASKLEELEKEKYKLEVFSEINNPEVQWNFKNGFVDMSKPVYRYMWEKHWQKEPMAKLMERITQMRVIPDLVHPSVTPSIEVQVDFGEGNFEPGVFLSPAKTIETPALKIVNTHVNTRLYTIALVDPDVPDTANRTYKQMCHWLVTNVPISSTSPQVQGGDTVFPYLPPHPQKGTKYHRYTLLVYEQPDGGKQRIELSLDKRDFDIRTIHTKYNLTTRGVSFFREVWDEEVSNIYKNILGVREPVFGLPPKRDPLLNEMGRKNKKYENI
ncbi:uncharacterized protein VTP21DRAFT_8901 [Calcarisporiella thermophila]|uniref:uncharacterized protein n=1 Tax=Calcarisporiella thermophila TaxID=911321 RepID=UPI003742434B